MKEQLETFISINELQGKTFVVEDYQRGYKWGQTEITQLLNDIEKHDAAKGPYCLQPIIVKPMCNEQDAFEVIDGQERLTSLYLLFACLDNSKIWQFTILYKTRTSSEAFLKDKSFEAFIE